VRETFCEVTTGRCTILGTMGDDTLVGTASGRLVVTAWVGDDEFIHRLKITGKSGDTPFTMDLRLSHFGAGVDVKPPPDGQVSELSDVLARASLGG
jgi:hypothetical protein